MSVIFASSNKQTLLTAKHDPNDQKYYSFVYRPDIRASSKVYLLDSIVIPSVFNGYYYVCVNPGISGSTAPVFPAKILERVTDGSVIWEARAYDLMLADTDSIVISSWSAGAGVTILDPTIAGGVTYCRVSVSDPTLTEFVLTNQTVLDKAGKTETFDRSVKVKIAEL